MTGIPRLDHAPRIVVAEDDDLLRALVVQMLTDDGFEVFEAAHAEEALRILCSNAQGVEALFTDIDMPGPMNGLELAARAVAQGDDRIGRAARSAAIWGSFSPQTVQVERPARSNAGVDRENVMRTQSLTCETVSLNRMDKLAQDCFHKKRHRGHPENVGTSIPDRANHCGVLIWCTPRSLQHYAIASLG
jgi:CheY-like chemotaxis protein